MAQTTSRTAAAIRQRRPFRSPEHETYVAVQRAASLLAQETADLLRAAGITGTQFNVLRILRGAGPDGLACGEITERLITRESDVTRLLDRMERQGLVTRARDARDRRVVITRITDAGLARLAGLDEPVAELHRRQLGHLGERRLAELRALLEAAVERPAPRADRPGG